MICAECLAVHSMDLMSKKVGEWSIIPQFSSLSMLVTMARTLALLPLQCVSPPTLYNA